MLSIDRVLDSTATTTCSGVNPSGSTSKPIKILKIAKGELPLPFRPLWQELRYRVALGDTVQLTVNRHFYVTGHLAIVLHRLHQHQAKIVFTLRRHACQLQILHPQAGLAIGRRHNAAIEGDRIRLLLDLLLEVDRLASTCL